MVVETKEQEKKVRNLKLNIKFCKIYKNWVNWHLKKNKKPEIESITTGFKNGINLGNLIKILSSDFDNTTLKQKEEEFFSKNNLNSCLSFLVKKKEKILNF